MRENTILPVGYEASKPDYDYGSNITLHIFNLTGEAERTVYNTEGERIFTVKGKKNGDTLSFFLDKLPKGAKILLRNVSSVSEVTGANTELSDLGTLLILKDNEITVKL